MSATRLLSTFAFLAAVSPVDAALLPTEIHYNGPAAGSDPDEFVELANSGASPLALQGYRFTAGLGLTFPDLSLGPGETVVVAPNPQGFLESFAGFSGAVLDASGSLSNAGETLTLLDAASSPIFSFAYDDRGAWPRSADGEGDSLQLRLGATGLADPASWQAGSPNPGIWAGSTQSGQGGGTNDPAAVPNPASLWLVTAGLLLLTTLRRSKHGQIAAPPHTLAPL